jgi:hypothetical protein
MGYITWMMKASRMVARPNWVWAIAASGLYLREGGREREGENEWMLERMSESVAGVCVYVCTSGVLPNSSSLPTPPCYTLAISYPLDSPSLPLLPPTISRCPQTFSPVCSSYLPLTE